MPITTDESGNITISFDWYRSCGVCKSAIQDNIKPCLQKCMNVYKELSIVMFKDKVRGDGYIATATSRFTNDVSTIYHLAAETCEQFELGLSDKETDTLAKKEADIVANVSEPPQLDALIERDMPPANTY